MAIRMLCKRASHLHGSSLSGLNLLSSVADFRTAASIRHNSQFSTLNRKPAFPVDTLALVRRLEAKGLPTKDAEAITENDIQVMNSTMENLSHEIKTEMLKIEISVESSLSNFKSEVKSSQDNLSAMLQRETERLKLNTEKMRTDLRHEINKVVAERSNLHNQFEREIHDLKARSERENGLKEFLVSYVVGYGGCLVLVLLFTVPGYSSRKGCS